MDFVAVIEQARALLQSKGRLTYRPLKRQFTLDDEASCRNFFWPRICVIYKGVKYAKTSTSGDGT